jgi:hypothetical protein
MRNFILDSNPNFGEAKVTIDNFTYELIKVANNGCHLKVWDDKGNERDQLTLTTTDMKAMFLLLTVKE